MYKLKDLVSYTNEGETVQNIDNIWKTLLIYYLIEKNKIIYKYLEMEIFNYEDLKEITGWSDKDIRRSLRLIGTCYNDYYNCPWCSKHNNKNDLYNFENRDRLCEDCGYGRRHGKCISKNLNKKYNGYYGELLLKMKSIGRISEYTNLSEIYEMKELICNIRSTFQTLCSIIKQE